MTIPYDVFTFAFLSKITEYDFIKIDLEDRERIVDGYLRRACANFISCTQDLSKRDDVTRTFTFSDDLKTSELDEIVDIVTDGMVLQWFYAHMYKQENLENFMNNSDFTAYSSAELLYRVTNAYSMCKKNFTNAVREYSYRHGDLTKLHL